MTKEEDFFKENFPEYVTEKGEFLTPYWDLFRAGVICANFELKVKIADLEKELKAEKEFNATLRKEIDEWTNSHTLCVKYKDLENAYNETEELLDKQIEATYKLFEENKELKEKLKPENCLKLLAKEGYIKFSSDQLTYAKTIIQDLLDNTDEYARQRAEDFLKESE